MRHTTKTALTTLRDYPGPGAGCGITGTLRFEERPESSGNPRHLEFQSKVLPRRELHRVRFLVPQLEYPDYQ